MAEPIAVMPVSGRADLKRFIRLPHRLRANDPQWVAPLDFEQRRHLDREKNPFFDHAEAEYFLAWRGDEVVGRISAHIDHRWDEYQGGKDGFFGFIELEDDQRIAQTLIDAAAHWLKERGRERILGPMNFTLNDECGLLIEGHDLDPVILQPWQPPYYQAHLEQACLMEKRVDLWMWWLKLGELKRGDQFAEAIHAAAEAVEGEHGITVRHMKKRDMEAEVRRFMEVYNEAWGENWGFVPVTDAEVTYQAKLLKPVLDEEWTWIAERDGEVLGAALTLPDINQVLKPMRGRLLPFGWWHFLTKRRSIDRVRVFALGVRPEYQHLGIAASFYIKHLEQAARKPQEKGETGWILEENVPMNRAMEGMGGEIIKRYRIYERAL